MKYRISVYTDKGVRKDVNQDAVLAVTARTESGRVLLAAVCDGVGGLSGGETASAAMARMLSRWFREELPELLYRGLKAGSVRRSLEALLDRANDRISRYGAVRHGDMGTTVVLLLAAGDRYYIMNVGDSRAYIVGSALRQMTKDHTLVQQEVDEGRMTRQEAEQDPRRNILTQCVGAFGQIEPDFYQGRLEQGESFLLCSDGFYHKLLPEELVRRLGGCPAEEESAMEKELQQLAGLAIRRLEKDNLSAVLVRPEWEGGEACWRSVHS